jgi:hypothetical protein
VAIEAVAIESVAIEAGSNLKPEAIELEGN